MHISWPKNKDEEFRQRYLEVTGEKIQATPLENTDGTHFMVGTSRIFSRHIKDLVEEFALELNPTNFTVKEELEPPSRKKFLGII